MLVVVTPLVCLELIDPTVPLLAQVAVEGLASFAGGFGLFPFSVGSVKSIARKQEGKHEKARMCKKRETSEEI